MPDKTPATNGRILVVDDEPAIVDTLTLLLETAGYEVTTAGTANECLEAVARQPADLVLLDLMLPDRPGLEALAEIVKIDNELPVVMLTAYGSIETAIEATRLGAKNFLTKPWNNSKLLLEIEQTLARKRLEEENRRLREQLDLPSPIEDILGKSEAMLRVFVMVRQVAPKGSTVLVSGESGTGKGLVAQAIHKGSPRADKPFLTVNSGTIPPEMLDSTLFGHVKGAFPGATRDRQGCFETAHEGTIFLDEVSALSAETQSKLQRVIEDRELVRVGSNDPVGVDVRIVAATNDDLGAAVAEGRFRADLYYRLNVIEIALPPLRERLEDLPILVEQFLTQICRRERNDFLDRNRRSTLRFSLQAMQALQAHAWPGNVRELRNVVERAVVLASGDELGPELLPASLQTDSDDGQGASALPSGRRPGSSLSEQVEDFERELLVEELEKHGYNQTETAKALKVALSTLNQKVQRLGIDVKRQRRD